MNLLERLPDEVRLRAESTPSGQSWLATLDERAAQIRSDWQLEFIEVLKGGSGGLVISALQEMTPVVLKIRLPDVEELDREFEILAAMQGNGYAKLIDSAIDGEILLLEALGPAITSLGLSEEQECDIICQTLMQSWKTDPGSVSLPSGSEKLEWLADFIETRYVNHDRPCNQATIDQSLRFIEQRMTAHQEADLVIVHGDAHGGNTLMIDANDLSAGCKFVDPDGLLAEPAADLSVPMREWNESALQGDPVKETRSRCQRLADNTGVAAEAIWQWGFIERISTGLVHYDINLPDEGSVYLRVADLVT